MIFRANLTTPEFGKSPPFSQRSVGPNRTENVGRHDAATSDARAKSWCLLERRKRIEPRNIRGLVMLLAKRSQSLPKRESRQGGSKSFSSLCRRHERGKSEESNAGGV